jgi:hypothetical protein
MSFEPPQTPPPDDETARGAAALLRSPEVAPYWLSAIIESADDAIISKTLKGIIATPPQTDRTMIHLPPAQGRPSIPPRTLPRTLPVP